MILNIMNDSRRLSCHIFHIQKCVSSFRLRFRNMFLVCRHGFTVSSSNVFGANSRFFLKCVSGSAFPVSAFVLKMFQICHHPIWVRLAMCFWFSFAVSYRNVFPVSVSVSENGSKLAKCVCGSVSDVFTISLGNAFWVLGFVHETCFRFRCDSSGVHRLTLGVKFQSNCKKRWSQSIELR